jgi:hypothetical protein
MDWSNETVYFSLGVLIVIVVILATAYVVNTTKENGVDFETRKIRFAAATFTGIMVLVLFTAILAFADPSDSVTGNGMAIFEKTLTSLSPIAGGIIGYLFSAKSN